MKNFFKMGALALVLAVSVSACGGAKKTDGGDTTKKDTTKVVADTTKKDTAKVAAADTTKKDTTKKK